MNVPTTGAALIRLLVPKEEFVKSSSPEISIVVPALNEATTIGEFVEWCWEGLRAAGVDGEIIIIDSSSDDTPNIALTKGARVLRTPKQGIGQAYIDAIEHVRGKFIIMGDCDLTYDFREIAPFVESYHAGYDFVMGSRFKGSIEDGAMPPLHRYFGTPLVTFLLNRIYQSSYSDIACGMRGLTREALVSICLTSKDWEYASEMLLKASRLGLRTNEVPVRFYKDREGRVSHHRRVGFWSPWFAGWINLKVMLAFSPETFLIKPGAALAITGLFLTALSIGSVKIGPIGFAIYSQLLGWTLIVLGYSLFQVGILARIWHKMKVGIERPISKFLTFNRGMAITAIFLIIGITLDGRFLLQYILHNFKLESLSKIAIVGLMMIVLGVQTFSFTLLLELGRYLKKTPQ
jgi:glycosyltransferase involved in cell wall biosynthesis